MDNTVKFICIGEMYINVIDIAIINIVSDGEYRAIQFSLRDGSIVQSVAANSEQLLRQIRYLNDMCNLPETPESSLFQNIEHFQKDQLQQMKNAQNTTVSGEE